MTAVVCRHVEFAYAAGSPTLRNVSFQVQPGEVWGLVGASGSGKSTLLRIIAGLLPSSSDHVITGEVTVGGQSASTARVARQVGFVFQDVKLLPFLSARDNLVWAFQRSKTADKATAGEAADAALELVGLRCSASAWPKELSGGMKARVALARALIAQPTLVLLDEAMASLDVGWRLHLHRELVELRDRLGLTVIMISHDLEEIARVADRILVLAGDGSVAAILEGKGADGRAREMERLIMRDHPAYVAAA